MPQPCRDDERDETVEKDPHDQTQSCSSGDASVVSTRLHGSFGADLRAAPF
jgi:hypothetical protein